MSNFIYITLDTIAPSNPSVKISGGALFATNRLVTLEVGTSDATTTNYQMKIWGDVDATHNTNIKGSEGESAWISYATNPQVMLSETDGIKTINVKIRDDVYNQSSLATSNIRLDTKIPTVTASNADVSKISKVEGKNTFSFTFSSDKNIVEYKVKLVNVVNATHDTGVTIGSENGSVNTAGTTLINVGDLTTVTVKALDLVSAGASTDGQKIVKIFVKDELGNWSA